MHRAIVMAGGHGSRLRPLTLTRPKPLVPVANRPVLAYILEWLRRHGFSEVLITLHYRADDIRRAFGDGRSLDLKITYRIEERPLGTAGSVKYAEDWIANEPFLIASGDALTDVDLAELRQRHRKSGAWLTLGLKRVQDPSAYGVVQLDEGGYLVGFREKPGPGQAFSNLVNTGIYCVEPQVLQWVPLGQTSDWSRDIFPRLMAKGLPLFGHSVQGYWCDIGSINDYRRGQHDALAGAVRVRLPAVALCPRIRVGPAASIAPGAVIKGPVLLGAGCRIERAAWVLPGSVIGEGTIVQAGACIRGAVLGARCQVGTGSVVRDCVLDDEVRIGAGCSVTGGAVIGRGSRLDRGVHVGGEQRVGPDQKLSGTPAMVPRGGAGVVIAS
jgi:mannose-1-phosphate guanylyltransferase / phosphomannomutase